MNVVSATEKEFIHTKLQEFCSVIPYHQIKHIDDNDENDFYYSLRFSDVDQKRFENNWPYIIQATRGTGYIYKVNNTRVYFYIRTIENKLELVVVNQFGPEKIDLLKNLKKFVITYQLHLCIKNIAATEISYWLKFGFIEKKTKWNTFSQKDDNSFPECVYELSAIALAHLPIQPGKQRLCRASHANKLRQFLKRRIILLEQYVPERHRALVEQLLKDNADFLEHKGVDTQQNVIAAHQFIFDDYISHKVRLISVENNVVIGFNYVTVVDNVIYGNALIHRSEPDLMRFLVWQGFHYLYHQLNQAQQYYVTLQGSEQLGQYKWKKGFAPLTEVEKIHLTIPEQL